MVERKSVMRLHHLAKLQRHRLVIEGVVLFEGGSGHVYGDLVIFAGADDRVLAHLDIKTKEL